MNNTLKEIDTLIFSSVRNAAYENASRPVMPERYKLALGMCKYLRGKNISAQVHLFPMFGSIGIDAKVKDVNIKDWLPLFKYVNNFSIDPLTNGKLLVGVVIKNCY